MRPTVSLMLPQAAMSYAMLRERARLLESLGYQGLWVVDHLWAKGMPDLDFFEGWTVIAGLAEATERLRLGTLVTCNSYRNPGLLAKTAITADHVSNGRVELGIGAGWMEEEYLAYGYRFPPIRERLEQLEEALAIITSLVGERRTTFEGKHYRLRDAPCNPKPVQNPFPITIGGTGKRVLMRLVARYATRWNCPMPAAPEIGEHLDALAEHCAALGRDPREVTISEQVCVILGRDDGDYRDKLELAERLVGGWVDIETMTVGGTPAAVVDGLRAKMAAGVTDFAVVFGDLAMPATLELFAAEVMPHLGV